MFKAIYNIIITISYIPYLLVIIFRKYKNKEHETRFKEKIFFNKIKRPKGFLFWFHAASLGELNSIFPFIEFYLKKDNKFKFLITTTTLSSYNEYKKKFDNNDRVFHQFFPYDLKFLVNNFLNNWNPDIVSFVDSEIWPNFIFAIRKRSLPFILFNARITKKTFKKWLYFKKFSQEIFGSFSLSISSSKETLGHLEALNVKNVKYFGNIKFCKTFNISKIDTNQFDFIKNRNSWCALSTHDGEELFCANVHSQIKKIKKDILTIIIPRHVNRVDRIFSRLKDKGLEVQIKNENDHIKNDVDVVLVNYYGSTLKYLNYFKQIFVGKSFLKKLQSVGGQNPIDAVKMGCKIYHGPYVYNFKEIYDYLDENKFAEKIDSESTLAEKIVNYFEKRPMQDNKGIEKINIYSEQIFNNVIKEYNKFIT